MKKNTLLLLWALILTVSFGVLAYKYATAPKSAPVSLSQKPASAIFNKKSFDAAFEEDRYLMLIVGRGDCNMCQMLLSDKDVDKCPVKKYYLDVTHHHNNMLVSQAFENDGFPRSYVFDQNRELIGIVHGSRDAAQAIDSIVRNHKSGMPERGDNLSVFGKTFDALLAYTDGDMEGMYKNTRQSLALKEYVFNNYLMYRFFYVYEQPDSIALYRQKTLGSLTRNLDVMTFESIVRELDPLNSALVWYDNSRAENKH